MENNKSDSLTQLRTNLKAALESWDQVSQQTTETIAPDEEMVKNMQKLLFDLKKKLDELSAQK